jgi:hypothetical protein
VSLDFHAGEPRAECAPADSAADANKKP